MNVGHRLADGMRSVVAYWSSVPTQSQFCEKGTLTPTEFIDAGDQLAFKFPTWNWQPAEPGRQVSWLPLNKQFLVTKNVPCRSRVRELDKILSTDIRVDLEGGWLLPGCEDSDDEEVQEISDIKSFKESQLSSKRTTLLDINQNYINESGQQDDAGVDISTFQDVDNLLQEDEDLAAVESSYFVRNAPDADIVRTRTYDLSITYDKYYQTPRLWLFGYDENGIPLKSHQIFEDILTEYVSKTVTVDCHPCTGIPTASIHPCKHSAVMKKVVNTWLQKGIDPRHDLAMFVLLKFISSVIPTIDYDFTMDIDMYCSTDESYKKTNTFSNFGSKQCKNKNKGSKYKL